MSMHAPHPSLTQGHGHAAADGIPANRMAGTQLSGEFVQERERLIDEELAQSFPASDPPSWVQGTAVPHP